MIRKTTQQDIPAIMEIVKEAQASLKVLGISQWQNGYPNEEAFEADIKNGISYVLEEQGKIIATTAISFAGEPTYKEIYDGTWLTDKESYGLIHRIAVKETCKRGGYAGKLIGYAAELAKGQGIRSLRIDTHEGNLPMRSFLKKQGFAECGIIYLNERKAKEDRRVAYEKKLSGNK